VLGNKKYNFGLELKVTSLKIPPPFSHTKKKNLTLKSALLLKNTSPGKFCKKE